MCNFSSLRAENSERVQVAAHVSKTSTKPSDATYQEKRLVVDVIKRGDPEMLSEIKDKLVAIASGGKLSKVRECHSYYGCIHLIF